MSRTITFEDACLERIVRLGHNFVTEMPKDTRSTLTTDETGWDEKQELKIVRGEQTLWRLEKGIKLWGAPTKEGLILQGEAGFIVGPRAVHKVAKRLYGLPCFKTVQSCSLPVKECFGSDIRNILEDEEARYSKEEDKRLSYWLASRCVSTSAWSWKNMFFVEDGIISIKVLCWSGKEGYSPALPVRPVATPRNTMLIDIDGADGSAKHPWKCIIK